MGLWLFYGLVLFILVIIIEMVGGVISPNKSRLAGKNKTRKNVLIHGTAAIGICFILMIIITAIMPPPEKNSIQNQQKIPAQPQTQAKKTPTPEEQIAALEAKQKEESKQLLERRKDKAWRHCRDYINTAVSHPRTVDIGMFDSREIVRDKKIVIVIDFTAKNSLGVAQPLRAYCEYWQQDMTATAERIINR